MMAPAMSFFKIYKNLCNILNKHSMIDTIMERRMDMECPKKCGGELRIFEMNGVKHAQCNNCGQIFSADRLQTQMTKTPPPPPKKEKKGSCLQTLLGLVGIFFFLAVIITLFSDPEDDDPTPEENTPFEVTLDVSSDGNKPAFTINTNLPDETELMLTLENSEGFKAQGHVTIEDGTATSERFSNFGDPLSGIYTLNISMGHPCFQSEHVRAVIGENGEYITGPYIISETLVTDFNMISADFDFNF